MIDYNEIGDRLCDFCPLDKKGAYSVPGSLIVGCEGSHCDVAEEKYLEWEKVYLRKDKIKQIRNKIS